MGSKQRSEILLVGNDLRANDELRRELNVRGCAVTTAWAAEEGLAKAKANRFNAVASDLLTHGGSGMELLRQLHPDQPQLPIILIDGHADAERAIEASKLGAFEYLANPIGILELVEHIVRAASQHPEGLPTTQVNRPKARETGLVGSSRIMLQLYKQIGLAADSLMTVLVRGETGTGKELVARAIHQHSSRASRPFVAFNCNAIPETLFESELFGYEAGAFTGARVRRIGWFEQANGGTLFLDEIGDLTLSAQVKLLRVLQEQRIQRLGGSREVQLDVRLLTATHRDLEMLIDLKEFRQDLFYRLSGLTIKTPELRQHREDISELAQHFLLKLCQERGLGPLSIRPGAVEFFENQPWPGNVREFEHAINRAALLARGHAIDLPHAQAACERKSRHANGDDRYRPQPLTDLVEGAQSGKIKNLRAVAHEQVERSLVERLMAIANGNQTKMAALLGVTRKTLHNILQKLSLLNHGLRTPMQQELPNHMRRKTNGSSHPCVARDHGSQPD